MNEENCLLAQNLVSKAYISQGSDALARRNKLIKRLLSNRRLPPEGWDDATIEMFIQDCALMDSNNFVDVVGVGEREGRVASNLVAQRHYRLAHGIGRSGDLVAEQPKAAGSSLLAKLSNLLVMDALRVAGMEDLGAATILPMATGMAVTMVLLALRAKRPPTARYVLWPRIDQKTCAKAVATAGFELIAVPMCLEGDLLVTDVAALENEIHTRGADNILCVLTTTSCFAPRGPDDVIAVAKLCAKHGVGHVINHAYGVQARPLNAQVAAAWRRGRVDAVVQSTDKNFMVPVGGAVVAAGQSDPSLVQTVAQMYPGRASITPSLDTFITLLSFGVAGWKKLLDEREGMYSYLAEKLAVVAHKHNERLLVTPTNVISMGMTLSALEAAVAEDIDASKRSASEEPSGTEAETGTSIAPVFPTLSKGVTFIGSMLFSRSVSGIRTVARDSKATVAGVSFTGYGSSHDSYPTPYMTAAAAFGTTREGVDEFCKRLDACLTETYKKLKKNADKRNRAA